MKILLDDPVIKDQLYPFTATRQAADIRIGILTIREKWEKMIGTAELADEDSQIAGNIIPTKEWVDIMLKGGPLPDDPDGAPLQILLRPWDIFLHNDWALRHDFELITRGRRSQPISSTNQLISPENIFIEAGAKVEHSILNASYGPIYIGKDAVVMEGSMIRGPFAMCEGAVLKMGTKVYGATTIGPFAVVAGEIKNSILFGYSNKAHDGYLGDSVIGEWCNLGAGTSCSNVKNTAGEVKAWSQAIKDYEPAGTKCGLLMGDYSRAAINTSFNTGTVVGVCCNIFGEGFPPKYIRDLSWGKERYELEKALQDIDNWKKLKGKQITDEERTMITDLYNANQNLV